jgi:hypothetical protein
MIDAPRRARQELAPRRGSGKKLPPIVLAPGGEGPTLRLAWPFGGTVVQAAVFLALLVGLAEASLRILPWPNNLAPPTMGSRHLELGRKLYLLEAWVKEEGPIECIALGSSIVNLGFDPEAFSRGYEAATGEAIQCFNFALDAMPAVAAAAIADIVVADFQPALLIYGADPRDLAIEAGEEDAAALLDGPWIRYRQGDFQWAGWLLEHSYSYRRSELLGLALKLRLEDVYWEPTWHTRLGFTPMDGVSLDVNEPADPTLSTSAYYYDQLGDYALEEENIAGLGRIMSQGGPDLRVLTVEMPVADGYLFYFGDGERDYQRYVSLVRRLSNERQVTFIETRGRDLIPAGGWFDRSHLNNAGASAFGEWLGRQAGSTR